MSKHTPTEINLNRKTRVLTVSFDDGESFAMSCEYLRVHSPSAEVQLVRHRRHQTRLRIRGT